MFSTLANNFAHFYKQISRISTEQFHTILQKNFVHLYRTLSHISTEQFHTFLEKNFTHFYRTVSHIYTEQFHTFLQNNFTYFYRTISYISTEQFHTFLQNNFPHCYRTRSGRYTNFVLPSVRPALLFVQMSKCGAKLATLINTHTTLQNANVRQTTDVDRSTNNVWSL
jgi:hypothetical protein